MPSTLTGAKLVAKVVSSIKSHDPVKGCSERQVCKLIKDSGQTIPASHIREALETAVNKKKLKLKGSKYRIPTRTTARGGSRSVSSSSREHSRGKSSRGVQKKRTKPVIGKIQEPVSTRKNGDGAKTVRIFGSTWTITEVSGGQPPYREIWCPHCGHNFHYIPVKNLAEANLSEEEDIRRFVEEKNQRTSSHHVLPAASTLNGDSEVLPGPGCGEIESKCDKTKNQMETGVSRENLVVSQTESSGLEEVSNQETHSAPTQPSLVKSAAINVKDFFLLPITDPNCRRVKVRQTNNTSQDTVLLEKDDVDVPMEDGPVKEPVHSQKTHTPPAEPDGAKGLALQVKDFFFLPFTDPNCRSVKQRRAKMKADQLESDGVARSSEASAAPDSEL